MKADLDDVDSDVANRSLAISTMSKTIYISSEMPTEENVMAILNSC